MKYKLINKITQEEHLCDKVKVDGFDYYMSDEKILNEDYCIHPTTLNISQHSFDNNLRLYWKKIIATNNPNIDLPKLVDEVDIAFETYQGLPVRFKTNSTQWTSGFSFGYNKSQETHSFSEDDMIEFGIYRLQVLGTPYENCPTKELLKIWKEQQIKTVYYE